MVSRASRRSPLCHAPLTSVASDSPNLLCWTCPAGGDWACRGLAFFVPGNRRQFAPVLCPLCRLSDLRRFDRSIQPIHRGLSILVTHRIFDGAGERLSVLMRMGSTFAAIEPFGLSLPECGPSISAMPLGTCGQGAAARLALFSRYAALRKSRAASVSCALHKMAKDAKPIFTVEHLESCWHANQRVRRVCCWLSPGVLGLINTDPVGREGGWDGGRARRTAGKPGLASNAFCSRQQSRPRKPHLSFPPIWRAAPRAGSYEVILISLIGERF